MDLESIGWDAALAAAFSACVSDEALIPARVSADHGASCELLAAGGAVLRGEPSGRLAYRAAGPEDLPAVGDWVAAAPRPGEGAAIIHHVLPRRTALVRKSAGRSAGAQVLVANADAALLVTSATLEWNPRRLERALALVVESGLRPLVVLGKCDLAADPVPLLAEARRAAAGAPVFPLSALTGEGVAELAAELAPRRSFVLLGSSGVGKSTLANRLLGSERLATRAVRASDDKGRHATTHRQLLVLPNGALLVDTPGLREIGLFEDAGGLGGAFPEIEALAGACRFADCGHESEPGCAVRAALLDGSLDPLRLASFRKLERELAALRARRDARARREERLRRKRFARAMRERPDKRRPR